MLDFLFPNYTCLVCKNELNAPQGVLVCDKCTAELPINTEPVTLKDDKQKQYFYKAHAAFMYQEPIIDLILRLKYGSEGQIAKAVAPYLAATLLHNKSAPSSALLIPVPLSKKREKQREYNQSLLLAKELAQVLHLPAAEKVILRIKATETQKNMTVDERARNLKNAFTVPEKTAVKGKHIILVDDVFTSGSTVNECARVLRKAGARRVDVAVIAAVI